MKRISSSEMIGMRFGRYEILKVVGVDKHQKVLFECRCDCGNIRNISRNALVTGNTKSCGCLNLEKIKLPKTHGETAGHTVTPTYRAWLNAKQRCNNPKNAEWHIYGEKGIKMCPEWEQSYEKFLADVGRKPGREYSIERIRSNGDYEPGNVKWATAAEQSRNTSQTRLIEYNGKTQCLTDWATELGFNARTLGSRLNVGGWSVEKAFTTPCKHPRPARSIKSSGSVNLNPLCPKCQSSSCKNGRKYDRQQFKCLNNHRFFA